LEWFEKIRSRVYNKSLIVNTVKRRVSGMVNEQLKSLKREGIQLMAKGYT
jgi:hypothetical protein